MRWEDERYVRLYTRDTVDWEMLPWQSRALFPLLLRKVDRAGILKLGKHGITGLAHTLGLPRDVTDAGLAGLLEDGSVEQHDGSLVMPNFIEAQEAPQSDAQRKRESRERHRNSVTNRDSESRNVTKSHERSHGVTRGHSVPSRAVPNRTSSEEDSSPSAPVSSFDFALVYDAYPRKEGRTKGIARLRKQIRTPEAFEQLQRAVAHFAEKVQAEGTEPQFIPHFSTWVSSWRDFVDGPNITARNGAASSKKNFRDATSHERFTGGDKTHEL